jgi:hypothetical protein
MEKSEVEKRKRALELLGEMVPRSMLSRAKGLAEEIRLEEYVRAYVARRAYILVFAIIVSIWVGLLAAVAVGEMMGRMGFEPIEHRILSGLVMGTVLLLFAFVPAFLLVWHLEKKALRKMAEGGQSTTKMP